MDLTIFAGFQAAMAQFAQVDARSTPQESLEPSPEPAGADLIRSRIDEFAARIATTPRALKARDRQVLIKQLRSSGLLEVRRAMEVIAEHLGVSRASVYSYAK